MSINDQKYEQLKLYLETKIEKNIEWLIIKICCIKIKNLLSGKKYSLSDSLEKINEPIEIKKLLSGVKSQYPVTIKSKGEIFKGYIEKDLRYFSRIFMRYISNKNFQGQTTIRDFFYEKYKKDKECIEMNLNIYEDDIRLYFNYKEKYYTEINREIEENNFKFLKLKLLENKLELSCQNYKTNNKELVFIFDTIYEILKECKENVNIINVVEYSKKNQLSSHATTLLANKVDKDLELLYYNPHGSDIDYTDKINEIKNIIDKNNEDRKNHKIYMYIEPVSCLKNFQYISKDGIGYCVAYNILWYDTVFDIIKNIDLYKRECILELKKYGYNIDKNIENKLMLDVKTPPILNWIKFVSIFYMNVTKYYRIKEKGELRKLTNDEIFDIIIKYIFYLYSEYIQSLSNEELNQINKSILEDLEQKKDTTYTLGKDKYGKLVKYQIPGKYIMEALEKDQTGIIIDKFREYVDLPLVIEDMDKIQKEQGNENLILTKLTDKVYLSDCKNDSECKNDKYNLYCDKFIMDEDDLKNEESLGGRCIVNQSLKTVGEVCKSSEECLSDNCSNSICRYNLNNKNYNKILK